VGDLRQTFTINKLTFGEHKARQLHRARLRALAWRRRLQEAEHEKVGLPEIRERMERNNEEGGDLYQALTELPPSLPDVTMMAIEKVATEGDDDDSIEEAFLKYSLGGLGLLSVVLPHLTGPFARDVAYLVSNPDEYLADTFLWRGWPRDRRASEDEA
jgi:hypothetical protein